MKTSFKVTRLDYDDSAREYEAYDAEDAACAAAEWDHGRDGWEWTWPIVYKVVDLTTGKELAVEVEREHVPSFFATSAKPLDMPSAVHVLWGSEVCCGDIRLKRSRDEWPENQQHVTLASINEGSKMLSDVTCERCATRAAQLVESLTLISNAKRCTQRTPREWSGHWRDFHRGHGCDLDPAVLDGRVE